MSSVAADYIRLEGRLVEAVETEKRDAARVKELTESLSAAKMARSVAVEADKAAEREGRLESLGWKEAASHKCDYAKDAPDDLVQAVRASEKGITGAAHHFTAAKDSPTLFRFKRRVRA